MGETATTNAINANDDCPKTSSNIAKENMNTIAGGAIKLGHSLKGMFRPEIDCKLDWPRQISLSNIAL